MTTTSKCMSFTAEWIGGNYFHKLTREELPSHTHWILDQQTDVTTALYGDSYSDVPFTRATERTNKTNYYWYGQTWPTGGNKPHDNVQPYVVTYFWRRIK